MFRVKNKIFAMYASQGNHHGGGRPAVWVKATVDEQELLTRAAPGRFFVPPYVGKSGWVGVWLDKRPKWKEIELMLRDAYRLTAPKKMLALLGDD
jgi:predicted DNA-binding protein (MmcQ/YjbR family)